MRTQPIFQRILFLVLISGVVAALPCSGFSAPPASSQWLHDSRCGPGLSMEALKKMGIVEIYQNW